MSRQKCLVLIYLNCPVNFILTHQELNDIFILQTFYDTVFLHEQLVAVITFIGSRRFFDRNFLTFPISSEQTLKIIYKGGKITNFFLK